MDDPWIMTVKGPSTSSSSSLDSLSSTSSTSSFIAGMGSNNASQPNSLADGDNDEEDDQSDQMPHRLPDDDDDLVGSVGTGDQVDSRRNHIQEENILHSPKHRVIVSSSSSSDDYSSQNAFAKFHKLDQQHQQKQNYQRNRSVSPPGPAPVFKNQIHVQNAKQVRFLILIQYFYLKT